MTPEVQQRWGRLAVRDRLRALLPSNPAPPDDEPPSRRGLAMFLSVVVAVVLWFSFSMRESYTVTMRVPIEVVTTPEGTALAAPPLPSVSVVLEGEGWTLLGLRRAPPAIRVYAEAETVDLLAALRESGLPAGVAVQSVQPATVDLALDTRTTRRLPIRLRQRIDVEPPYDLLRPPQLEPDSVLVTGAQSLLGSLADWPTELFVAQGIDEGMTQSVALSDTFGGLLAPAVRQTIVDLDVGEFTVGDRVLDVVVVNLPPSVAGVRFEPAQVRAEFRVPLRGDNYEQAQTSAAFRAVVDWADIVRDSTSGTVPVAARWPSSLTLRNVALDPSRVGYFIQRRPPPADE